jgi:hypothetical protein
MGFTHPAFFIREGNVQILHIAFLGRLAPIEHIVESSRQVRQSLDVLLSGDASEPGKT